MTPRQFYQAHKDAPETLERVAKEAQTTVANFQQIALYGGSCSARLARRLAQASGGAMTLEEILFPKDRDESAA